MPKINRRGTSRYRILQFAITKTKFGYLVSNPSDFPYGNRIMFQVISRSQFPPALTNTEFELMGNQLYRYTNAYGLERILELS